MANIAVLAGPALGHVSRLFQIFSRVREASDASVTFISPGPARFLDQVVGDAFPTLRLPQPRRDGAADDTALADAVEAALADVTCDLVVHDMNPLRWLPLVRFPPCPRIHVTNAFLTGPADVDFVQTRAFAQQAAGMNAARRARDLPALTSALELYNADRVLLADPPRLAAAMGPFPQHYIACGHCSWTAPGTLPPELLDKENLLVASMGSSGKKNLDPETVEQLARITGANATVYIGALPETAPTPAGFDFVYRQLPLSAVLERACAVISQGGAGSTYQALEHGCPVFVCPTHRNQEILGQHLQAAGLGLLMDGGPDLAARLGKLAFAAVRARVADFSGHMRQQDGPGRMAAEILSFL